MKILTLTFLLFSSTLFPVKPVMAEKVEISSLEELAEYAGKSGNTVRMEPGTYSMSDYIPLDKIPERRENENWYFLEFSGSDNTFDLSGVTIKYDTRLGAELNAPVHTPDNLMSGENNLLEGVTIRYTGNNPSGSENVLSIIGANNTLRNVTLHVRGSYPYGYGDLFGKGGGSLLSTQKHSGLRIAGPNTRVIGCKIYMRSFGHGFYVQGDGKNTYFEDCYVEGEMRPTDEMLSETSGPAYENDFRSVYRNRDGKKEITPGYMKSLAEDGFRTYGVDSLTFINCTSKNMRGAFELRSAGHYLENCKAIGNERGFWIRSNSRVINSRGDAKYGPLLYVEGKDNEIELELLPDESDMKVHALATISGLRNKVSISPQNGRERSRSIPIKVGYLPPAHGENMSPLPQYPADWIGGGQFPPVGITLWNQTTMPVIIGEQAIESEVHTKGKVLEDNGRDTEIALLNGNKKKVIPLDRPLGNEGMVSFKMTVPRTYRTGAERPKKRIPILEISGFATYKLRQNDPEPFNDPNVINLEWLWEQEDASGHWRKFVPKISGPETYYVQYTWDAERGLFDGYIDGNPLRIPGEPKEPWSLEDSGRKIILPSGEIEVSDVEVAHHYKPSWRAQALVPDEFRGRNPQFWGLREDAEPMDDLKARKGDLLYTAEMDDPADVSDWQMEGPGQVAIEEGWMRMWSPEEEYHHVFWCPKDFPDSFVAEWEVQITSEHGLCLLFFAATGKEGQDIFHPDLPERDGNFMQYNRGLHAYHISYYANTPGKPGRISSNMRKDGKFYLMDQGPVAILPGSKKVHHMRLIKDGGHIQLQVNGKVHLDFTDTGGERFGPRYKSGKIGLRQMQWTEGLYRNFKVWELKDRNK